MKWETFDIPTVSNTIGRPHTFLNMIYSIEERESDGALLSGWLALEMPDIYSRVFRHRTDSTSTHGRQLRAIQ